MGVQDILQWWNLIYVAPLLVSLVWIVATVLTGMHGDGLSHGGHGIGYGIGHGADHGVGHAVHEATHGLEHALHNLGHIFNHGDAGHSHPVGHDSVAHDHSVHGQGHHAHISQEDSLMLRLLGLFGIGQVPITLIIGVFLLSWGAFGMAANQLFGSAMKYPAIYIWPSMGVTFVVSSIVTRSMAAIVARILPSDETYGVSRFELIGSIGRTIYATTECTGTVDIKDRFGTVHRVQAKTEPEKDALPSGTAVIVIDFDDNDKRFVVRKGAI